MKRLGIVIILLFGTVFLHGQTRERVSGYLGKRVVIGVGTEFSASHYPQKQSSGQVERGYSLNRAFLAYTDFAVRNTMSLGIRAGFMTTSASFYEGGYPNGVKWQDSEGKHFLGRLDGTPGISDQYFGVHLKRFLMFRGSLAPIGVYFGLGFNVHNYKLDFSTLRYTVKTVHDGGAEETRVFVYGVPKGRAIYPEIFIELGRSMPMGERFMFDFSFKGGALINKYSSRPNINHDVTLEEFTVYDIKSRLRDLYVFNCSVKISVLL